MIATGGIGGLYEESTNPRGSFGQGLALAARAGAALADMHFVQFHPTALDVAARPMPLVSEAVRGEGATLIDETGERFMADTPGAELAPRDVVARAIWRRRAEGHRVFLDARAALGAHFATRFPIIAAACRAGGVDPTRAPIPVKPAQHYHMGGVAVDREGRSSVNGPVGVRRGRLHRAARRQSPGEQFAQRSRGVRGDRRPIDRPRPDALSDANPGRCAAAFFRPARRPSDPVARGGRDA